MVKKILVMVLVVWCIVVLRGGVPAECQSKLQAGCFMPASPNDTDSSEDREIRDILYDATVQFLKDMDAKGGGGKGLTQIACDIAAQLMCFASGVEASVEGGQVRRMIGVPQKVWRKMLKENPFVPRRLLAAIWQAAARNVEQIDFSTPEIKNAFADIRRLWKRGGRGGGGGIASTGGSKSSASGRAARSVGRSSFPRSGDFVRRPPVAFTRPIPQPAGGSSGQAGGIQQGDGEIPASPPVTQGPLQPPTTGGASTPSGTGAPAGGQGQGLNICLFCVPQQSNQQQQQQNQPPSNKQQQGGQNNQQSGCTCIVDGQQQNGTGTDRPILRSILARIDGKLSRTENTPKDEITLEEFRNGLSTLIGVAKRNGVSDNTINADNTFGLASQGGIMELLWISPTICKVGGSDGYSDKECVPDRLGDINAHLSKCPYIVLKNLRMCLDLNRKNDEISKELLVLVDKVIKKVLEDDDSLLKRLRNAHRNMKTFITGCGGQVSSIAAVIRNKVQSSQCASATAAVKNNALNAVKAMEVLLRNVAPRPGKAPGTCFSKDTAIVPRNFHAAILDGLDSYKVLPGFTPLVAIIPEIEFKECVIDDKSTNAYSLIKGDNVININTSLADVFAALLGIKNMQEEMDVRKKGNTGKCFDISDDRRIKELFSACGELQDLSLPICAAAGLAKWARSKEVPLYTYPMAGDASNPFLKIYKYCSYVPDSDKWPSSSGDSLTTFEHSTMAKNLLLCMIYKAFNEGYSQSMSKKGGTIPQLAKLFLGHGCRENVDSLLNYTSDTPERPPQCRDIGPDLGAIFKKDERRPADRNALTLAEILDVAYYKKLMTDDSVQILSALTGVEGGPIWQYCIDPSMKNLHRSIEMLLKFWMLTAKISDDGSKIRGFAMLLLGPLGVNQLPQIAANIVDLDSSKSPLDVIARSILNEGDISNLVSIVLKIIKTLNDVYPFHKGNEAKIIRFGDREVSVITQQDGYTLKYKGGSGCSFSFSPPKPGEQSQPITWEGGTNCENEKNIVIGIMQAFILYYMIGSPYFFAEITGDNKVLFESKLPSVESGLQSLEKETIFGSGNDVYIKAGTLPFRKQFSWGLWRLPFLIFESAKAAIPEKKDEWYKQWKKITHALLENVLLEEIVEKFNIVAEADTEAEKYNYTTDRNGIKIERKIVMKGDSKFIIPTLEIGSTSSKVDNIIACLKGIFAVTDTDNWVLNAQRAQLPQSYVVTEKVGEKDVLKWASDAPLVCKYLKPDDGDGLENVTTLTAAEDRANAQKKWTKACVSLVNSILLFIALNNKIITTKNIKGFGDGIALPKQLISNDLIKLFPSIFGFAIKKQQEQEYFTMIAKPPQDFISEFINDKNNFSVAVGVGGSDSMKMSDLVRNVFKFAKAFGDINGLINTGVKDTDAVEKLFGGQQGNNKKGILKALMDDADAGRNSSEIFSSINQFLPPKESPSEAEFWSYQPLVDLAKKVDELFISIYGKDYYAYKDEKGEEKDILCKIEPPSQ